MKKLMMAILMLGCFLGVASASETVWLDVRSAEEFAAGHLKGAINIPHTEITLQISTVVEDKSTPIALYCKSGRRAGIALEALKTLGYSNVTNHGGYEDLKQQQHPDERH